MDNNINNNMDNSMNNKKTNIFAILGLIFSFFFSIGGLVLSIVGLIKSKELNDGKGLSIVGLVISLINIIITVVFLGVLFFGIYGFNKIRNQIQFQNIIDENTQCENAYSCVLLENGKYSCHYNNLDDGLLEEIICDKEDVLDKINEEKDAITGVWKPEKITDINGMEINVAKFYDMLENPDKDFELQLHYTNNTFFNTLSGYEDKNDIEGTYKIEGDKIYITNNNNKVDIVEIKYDENNKVYLILKYNDMNVYLYRAYTLYPE